MFDAFDMRVYAATRNLPSLDPKTEFQPPIHTDWALRARHPWPGSRTSLGLPFTAMPSRPGPSHRFTASPA